MSVCSIKSMQTTTHGRVNSYTDIYVSQEWLQNMRVW